MSREKEEEEEESVGLKDKSRGRQPMTVRKERLDGLLHGGTESSSFRTVQRFIMALEVWAAA
eukprot:3196821-Rhodomonas_salina.1